MCWLVKVEYSAAITRNAIGSRWGAGKGKKSMNEAGNATVIGRSMKIRGEFSGTDDLLIEGEVEGTVSVPGARLTVGPEGRVRATLLAQDIVIAGRVAGEIHASGSVSLLATAVVLGNIYSARFSMEENSMLRGQIDPGGPSAVAGEQGPTEEHTPVVTAPGVQNSAPALDFEHLPAGLAAVARQYEEGGSAEASSGSESHSGNSPELAETEA